MLPATRHPARHSAGFSLIEILVGVGIGMIGIIVILQVFSLTEGQRRSTSGGDDAVSTGAIALHTLQRDIRQGGYGIASLNILGCNITFPAGSTIPAMPVVVNPAAIPAGDANTDVIAVVYGNANAASEGDRITTHTAGSATLQVQTQSNFITSDWVIPVPQTLPAPCNLNLTQTIVGGTLSVVNAPAASMQSGTLFNLGQNPRMLVYAIRNGNLTQCDFRVNNCATAGNIGNTAIWTPIAENVVMMRAEYGRDTTAPAMDGVVDVWDQTTPATACGWARVSALRLALVARNNQYDKLDVTTAALQWAGTATTPIDLSGDGNWQHYRYKLFQTIVPIRNVAWMGVQAGC